MKRCNDCKLEKNIEQFSSFKLSKDKLNRICKDCGKTRTKHWREKTKEKNKQRDPYEHIKNKTCYVCKNIYLSNEFFQDIYTKDGLQALCKNCSKKHAKKQKEKSKNRKNTLTPDKKRCFICKKEYLASDFFQDIYAKDGLNSSCKNCEKIRNKQDSLTLNGRFRSYRNRPKKRTFELTLEEFDNITSKPCYYCGLFEKNKTHTGIDRVNNSQDYLLDNCIPCCKICNLMKRTSEQTDFINQCKIIAKRFYDR